MKNKPNAIKLNIIGNILVMISSVLVISTCIVSLSTNNDFANGICVGLLIIALLTILASSIIVSWSMILRHKEKNDKDKEE